MKQELLDRINAALDGPDGVEGDPELGQLLADDDEAMDVVEEMMRIEGALRQWPTPKRSTEAFEALALRIEQRLDETLAPIEDPTLPPQLLPGEGEEEARREGSGQFSLQNLANLRTSDDDEIDLIPLEGPPPTPPPAATGERFSMSDVVAEVARRPAGPAPRMPSIEPAAPMPIEASRSRRPLVWTGLAAAAAIGLAVVGGVATFGADESAEMVAQSPGVMQEPVALPDPSAVEEPAMQLVEGEPAADEARAQRAVGAPAEATRVPAEMEEAVMEAPPEGAGLERAPANADRAAPVAELGSRPRRGGAPAPPASGARGPERTASQTRPTMGPRMAASGGSQGALQSPSREQVIAAMRSVEPAVRACRGGRSGVAMVRITVGSSGRVRSAVVSGDFEGTPQGSCVARAVRAARFPPFRQDSFRVTYPFQL